MTTNLSVPPAAEGLPLAALDSATEGADRLDAAALTPTGRNFLAHALVQLARDGWLRTEPGVGFEPMRDREAAVPAAVSPPPATRTDEQATLRDRIRRAICEAEGFAWDSDMLEPDEYGEVADAVLADLPETARLHDEILTGRAEIAQLRDLLRKENQRANDAITRETTAEQAAEEAQQERDQLHDRVADYENRLTWHTTCGSCARVLDSSIRATEQTEAHRLALSEALGLGTGAPWDAIRERAAELHGGDEARPGCPDPIECGHEAALGQVEEKLDAVHALGTAWSRPSMSAPTRAAGEHLLRLLDEYAPAEKPAGGPSRVADEEQPATEAQLASLAVNAANALRDEKRHYEVACQENAQLRATVARVQQLHDNLEAASALTSPDDSITRAAAARRIAGALDGWTAPAATDRPR